MSEEEIIKNIKEMIQWSDHNTYKMALQGLLDLYCSKTEQLETAMNSLKEEKEKNKELEMQLLEKDLHIDGLKEDRRIAIEEIQEEYYISKDKIKEIIYPTPTNPISYEIQTSDMYKKILELLKEE